MSNVSVERTVSACKELEVKGTEGGEGAERHGWPECRRI